MNGDTVNLGLFPLFSELGDAEKNRIESVTKIIDFSKRQVVLAKDSNCQGLWILSSGQLQGIDYTADGREAGLYFVRPGHFFGELSLIDGLPHPEHVIATTSSKAILIPYQICEDLFRHYPNILKAIAATLARKMRLLTQQRTLLTLTNPVQKVASQILSLVNSTQPVELIHQVPTHQELAIMMNLSRETVTRSFSVLQSHQVLRKQAGNSLLILDQETLEAIATGAQQL